MSTKLQDLADKLTLSLPDLKKKIRELGFEVAPRGKTIDDDIAELILDELKKKEEKGEDVAEIYDEMIAQEREREIVKTQRKKMAGKPDKEKFADKAAAQAAAQAAAAKAEEKIDLTQSLAIPDLITVKEFSEKTGIKAAKIIGELMKNGILANINQQIDFETAQIIADDMSIKIKRIRNVGSLEDFMAGDISNLLKEDDPKVLKTRPPVVCVMGHVDHGKTSILDKIRETDVAAGEAGGITQRIGAYQVTKNGRQITFLDTPGHEAFTAMRARGAKATDIAILVVAAEEGVKPQTIEAINHAKEAGVPIIVAINKMDKEGANPDKVKAELAEHGLTPEDWGGKTVMLPVSAKQNKGISELLDLVLLTADMEDLKANPNREAVGTVIEAHLDNTLGPMATVLINTGTLKIMDNIIIGDSYGRIKLMRDFTGKSIKSAPPSTPVLIAGLSATPKSGDILQAVKDEATARKRAYELSLLNKQKSEEKISNFNLVISNVKADKILKIVLKADTKGSIEAIKQSVAKIKHEDVAVKIIHTGVGKITESDVIMAAASKGIVFGFNTEFGAPYVIKTAEREHVEVRNYNIIYKLLEDITKILNGLLEDEVIEVVLGRAQVKQVFLTKKKEKIIGCRVISGKMKNKTNLRIIRGKDAEGNEKVVGVGFIDSLRKIDVTVPEVLEGNDCGIRFTGDMSVAEGDLLESFAQEKRQRTL